MTQNLRLRPGSVKPINLGSAKNQFRKFFLRPRLLFWVPWQKRYLYSEVDLRGTQGARATSIFCKHFQELRTMLFEVQLIINNATLIYVYPNSIETCLTPKYLLFGRQLLLSSNTTSTLAANLTVLSSITDKINRISNHFWARWKRKYVVNLRETQRISKLNIKKGKGTQTLLENCH